MTTSLPPAGQASSDSTLRVLMIGPVPRIYGGISAVVGMLLDSELPRRCRLTYAAEGTRQGPLGQAALFLSALLQTGWLLRPAVWTCCTCMWATAAASTATRFTWRLAGWLVCRLCFTGTCPAMPARRRNSMRLAVRRGEG